MGFYLPWLDVLVVRLPTVCWPSANELGEPQEEQSCIRCSAQLTLKCWIFCRNSCTGSAKVSNTIKLTRITLPTALNVGLARGLPEQYPRAIFPSGKAEIAAIRQEEKRAAEAKAFPKRASSSEREKAARLERHKSAAVQPAAKDKDADCCCSGAGEREQAQLHSLL